jgi:hypothetical protein
MINDQCLARLFFYQCDVKILYVIRSIKIIICVRKKLTNERPVMMIIHTSRQSMYLLVFCMFYVIICRSTDSDDKSIEKLDFFSVTTVDIHHFNYVSYYQRSFSLVFEKKCFLFFFCYHLMINVFF